MALSILSFVLQNLDSLIQKDVGLLWGVDKQMKKLSSTLSTIQAVLEDAEMKQFQDKAIKDWLRKLREAAYELDDILDDCSTEAGILEFKGQTSGSLKKVTTSLSYPVQNILFRHKIGNRMKEIEEKLDAIANERNKFHLHDSVVGKFSQSRETTSCSNQPELYGRDEDKEKIVKVLIEGVCESKDVSVYPIIGKGGLGKTTLAHMVFNDERVKRHFEPKIWVYVSQDFDVSKLIKTTIESISGKPFELTNLDSMQKSLQTMLNGKRYLIVLDDVWNEDQENWDKLKYALTCGSKGSAIIVTARLEKVASIVGTIEPHHLSFLSEDDCWMLFKQRAFGHGNEERANLVAIGKEIVKKCGGVPLAAKALGGLLQSKREESEWDFVKKSEIWSLPQDEKDENSILPALRLSYYNLPLELRRCFAYCALFPKGFEIEKGELIRLWMANGYISSKGELELEDIGDQIWNELCWSFLFQVLHKYEGRHIFNRHLDVCCGTWFKMHDFVHDLAQSIMKDDCGVLLNCESYSTMPGSIRNVSVDAQKLVGQDFLKFGSLRVFDRSFDITKLSSSIGNLKHLRYLDLSSNSTRQLPDSICSLWNLQTLVLDDCWRLRKLPKNMNYLRNLQHLHLTGCPLVDMPPNIGHLTSLKTLTKFTVGKSRGCSITELQHLNLRGELHIDCLDRVRNPTDAKKANLWGKQNLHWLKLSWSCDTKSDTLENVEEVLESLEPYSNVKVLDINNYKGSQFPNWMRGSILENIVQIKLYNCSNCLQLPPLGQLPLLQRLEIDGMGKVEYIDNDFISGGPVRGFLSLEVLSIYKMPNLKGLSREEGRELFPCLREIEVWDCPKLSFQCISSLQTLKVKSSCEMRVLYSISTLSSLTSLEVGGNDEVTCFPEEVLTNLTLLEELNIRGFRRLKLFPKDLASLVTLKSLYIVDCPELESLPEEGLRGLESLRKLSVIHCNKLSSFSNGFQHLTALESLVLGGCPKLVVVPEDFKQLNNSLRELYIDGNTKLLALGEALQHSPSLQSLYIWSCDELTSVPDWLGNLTSLQSLQIIGCSNISSLPASIQSLTKLRSLTIWECNPELSRRCEAGKGEDWDKIAHVLDVDVKETRPLAEKSKRSSRVQFPDYAD